MIVAAGLTPAWQQILRFDALRLGEVNRAVEAHWCASGKVKHFHAYDGILPVVVHNHAGCNLLGVDDFGIVQS